MAEHQHKRGAVRYPVSIPATLVEGAMRVSGLVETLSTKGALVTHVSEQPEIGTVGRFRLTNLCQSVRTTGADRIRLSAQVARHDPAGFAVVFLSGTEKVRELLHRVQSRSFEKLDEED